MFSKFLFSLLALAAFVAAYANPGSCFGSCNVHDPAVIRRPDGTYFRFSTGNRIQIASASCLAGPWKIEGSALPNGSSIDLAGNMDLWAPDISLVDNTYYLYYSVGTFGSQSSAIGVVTSTTMDVDTWMDHGSTGVTSSSGDFYNAIDSNLVQLHRGGYQLNFGSSWGDLHQVPMVSPLASNDSATQIAYDPAGTHAEEGSFMIYRKGYHYIFFSWGSCCGYDINPPPLGQEYKIYVCRSRSSTRGFVDKNGKSCTNGGGTLVLESHDHVYGPGGQGVITDPSHGEVLYYHYVDTTVGYADGQKLFGWNTIDWTGGWPAIE